MKKIIITGISSFVGVHLARYFISKKYQVIGTISRSREMYQGMKSQRLDDAEKFGVQIEQLDIVDKGRVSSLVQRIKPSIWFHLAAWTENYGSLDYDLKKAHRVNVEPLSNIYETLSQNETKGVIFAGTNAEYSDTDSACLENDICLPTMPYGLAKLSVTIRSRQLAFQYGIATRVARVFIPYGLYDNPGKLLPSVVQSLQEGRSIDLSPCTQERDYIYIDDLMEGFNHLVDDLKRNCVFDIFNICSGEGTVLKEFLRNIAIFMESNTALLNFGARKMRSGEQQASYGSNSKAKKLLNWSPHTLEEGLQKYINEMNKKISFSN